MSAPLQVWPGIMHAIAAPSQVHAPAVQVPPLGQSPSPSHSHAPALQVNPFVQDPASQAQPTPAVHTRYSSASGHASPVELESVPQVQLPPTTKEQVSLAPHVDVESPQRHPTVGKHSGLPVESGHA